MTTSLPYTVQEIRSAEDLDAYGAEVASDYEALQQDIFHILEETPGSNIDDPDRGVGIEDLLSSTTVNAAAVAANIDRQLIKDDRIDASETLITALTNGNAGATFRIDITIQVGKAILPFTFLFGKGGLSVAP